MTLRAKQDQVLLHFLCNLCFGALFSTDENDYDLESETGPDVLLRKSGSAGILATDTEVSASVSVARNSDH